MYRAFSNFGLRNFELILWFGLQTLCFEFRVSDFVRLWSLIFGFGFRTSAFKFLDLHFWLYTSGFVLSVLYCWVWTFGFELSVFNIHFWIYWLLISDLGLGHWFWFLEARGRDEGVYEKWSLTPEYHPYAKMSGYYAIVESPILPPPFQHFHRQKLATFL